jgi:tetratricopeptide (TPR) repeat protein
MTRICILIVAVCWLTGCNDQQDSSPYSDILGQPPYQALTDSIKKEPSRDELYFRRAILLNKNNYQEPSLADFQKAWSLSKQESYAVGISNILMEKNNDQAIDFLKKSLTELPESLLLQLSLVRAYDAANRTDDALSVVNNILNQQPDQVNTLMLQSDLLQKKKDTSGAVTALEKACHITPLNIDLSYKLAYLYAETKNPKVIALTDSLIARDSLKLHAEPLYVKGLYYSNINDKTKALQWFNEIIRQDYNYLNAYIEKGKIQMEQKKITDALKTFSLANTISPSFADAWYWIGRCQEQMGQKEEAKLNYQKAYSLDKTFAEAKEAAEAIK